jgi:hypothetical protein
VVVQEPQSVLEPHWVGTSDYNIHSICIHSRPAINIMSTVVYEKIAPTEADTVPVHSPPPPSVPAADDHRQSIQFARAAFVFRDRLDDVRKKHALVTVTDVSPAAPSQPTPSPTPATAATKANKDDPVVTKRLRFLRLIQSALTAGLSIAIAALQMKTYISFQHTKDVAGAWPTHPNLLPTLMLMGVAIGAAVFDLSLIVAYLFPKQARLAFRIAMSSYSILTTAKGLSYTLTAVLCRGGYNFGNASGQNNDLWSWTCTDQAAKFDAVTNAEANCQGQVSRSLSSFFPLFPRHCTLGKRLGDRGEMCFANCANRRCLGRRLVHFHRADRN